MFNKLACLIVLFFCAFGNAYAQLKLIGDSSKDTSLNKQYCSQVVDITIRAADDLAESWKMNSKNIEFRRAYLVGGVLCCLVLDTPKGPFYNSAYLYFADGKDVIAGMNNVGYREGQSNNLCQSMAR